MDPDNGVSAGNPEWQRILQTELRQLYDELNRGDTLVLYQHQQRFRRDWLDETLAQFAEAIKIRPERVSAFQCRQLAYDVALSAAKKG